MSRKKWKLGRVVAKKQPQVVKIPPHMHSRKNAGTTDPSSLLFSGLNPGKKLKILQRLGFWKTLEKSSNSLKKYKKNTSET